MGGTAALQRAVAAYHRRFYGLGWNPDRHVTVTAGATEALYAAITALVDPGDEVILFEPFYDAHQADVLLAGGVPRYVTLRRPDFRFEAGDIERLLSPRTTMIVLNNPGNPSGKVFTRAELDAVAAIAIERDLVVVSDEVYEFLTFDAGHVPIATLPGMRERTVTVSSTGKTFGMTGWKIGYAVAEDPLTEALRATHQFVTFAVNTPGQHAMAAALGRLPEYLPELRALYRRKRDLLAEGLRRTPFVPHLPQGSYFIMADIPASLGMTDVECAMRLVTDAGVAAIPPSLFYASSDEGAGMLRFCFAKRDETIEEGVERLRRFAA
jgi:N-succinyldiaminopimelate aminotransferase